MQCQASIIIFKVAADKWADGHLVQSNPCLNMKTNEIQTLKQ